MSIQLNWCNEEKTILCHNYEGTWTLEDLHNMIDKSYSLIDSVGHAGIVDIIADVSQSQTPPGKLLSVSRHYRSKRHERQGIQVVVGTSLRLSFMKIITQTAMAIIPQARNVRFASTVEEAHQIIKSNRQQLHHSNS